MASVSFVNDGSSTYDLKDIEARRKIEELAEKTAYIGVTTTPLTDGSTTKFIIIDGQTVEASKGDIAIYGSAQFLWIGTKWQEFGDLSSLGSLAQKDSVSTQYTPEGTIANTDIDYTPEGAVTLTPDITRTTVKVATDANQAKFVGEMFKAEYDAETETLALTSGSTKTGSEVQAITALTIDAGFTGTPATLQTTSTFTGEEATITVSGND